MTLRTPAAAASSITLSTACVGTMMKARSGGSDQVPQVADDRPAERGLVPRVDRDQRPGEAGRLAGQHREPGPAGRLGGPDQRDTAGREELAQPLRRDQLAYAGRVTGSAPAAAGGILLLRHDQDTPSYRL